MKKGKIKNDKEFQDKHDKIQFAMLWFCAGMLLSLFLMALTQA